MPPIHWHCGQKHFKLLKEKRLFMNYNGVQVINIRPQIKQGVQTSFQFGFAFLFPWLIGPFANSYDKYSLLRSTVVGSR